LGCELRFPEAHSDNLVGRQAVEHALTPGMVGRGEATEQLLEGSMGVNGDAEHLVLDAAVEALAHAVIRYARSRCHWRLAGSLMIWHMVSPSGTRGTGSTRVRADRR
jgi:hypothetical protein